MLQRQYGFKRTYNVSRYVPRMTCYISNICHAIEGLESFMAVSKLGCKAESEANCMFSQATITIGTMKSSKYYSLAFLAANCLTPRLLSKQRQMSIHIPLLLPSVSTRKPPPLPPRPKSHNSFQIQITERPLSNEICSLRDFLHQRRIGLIMENTFLAHAPGQDSAKSEPWDHIQILQALTK
jgi:hypothetical protein